jgi:hypothetical protein
MSFCLRNVRTTGRFSYDGLFGILVHRDQIEVRGDCIEKSTLSCPTVDALRHAHLGDDDPATPSGAAS